MEPVTPIVAAVFDERRTEWLTSLDIERITGLKKSQVWSAMDQLQKQEKIIPRKCTGKGIGIAQPYANILDCSTTMVDWIP